MDRAGERGLSSLRHVLGAVMNVKPETEQDGAAVLDAVALLESRPADRLVRGQVGTVVDKLDGGNVLVEFSDDEGRAYAIVPCPKSALIVLHYVPEAAA